MITSPASQKDCYKEFHREAYHPEVSEVYSNWVSRGNQHCNITDNEEVMFVGLQYFIMDFLIEEWNTKFFDLPKAEACDTHRCVMNHILMREVDVTYLEDLHDLGYLPLRIKALKEGTMVPYQVTPMTIVNTHPGFAWLTNSIETALSCDSWPIQTSATTSFAYYKQFAKYFEMAGVAPELIPFMGHDFSFRGMFGRQAAAMSGFGHLAAGFVGTDTIPAVPFACKYYGADLKGDEIIGCSVNATEHSVTCSWLEEGEVAFIRYLMREKAPTGFLSIVADTWDFWNLVVNLLPMLKKEIMERDGKVVIRPDSGDPVDIICGDPDADPDSYEYKGLIECLWDIFGGTVNEKGFKLLDEHIGAIYGDAITLERQKQICTRLIEKGFAPVVVLGIGSFSFQYVTRDTHASAIKATNVVKAGKDVAIFKDPATDTKKKSAKGLICIERDLNTGKLVQYDQQTREQEEQGLLTTVFEDGKLTRTTTLSEIRALVRSQI